MINCCTKYIAPMPDITIHMNCDTPLAINLRTFDLSDQDELVFTIKNYDYIESPHVFLFRARKGDEDDNGEVIFMIPSEDAKRLKPGAFYNFALLTDAFNAQAKTGYRKLTDNGKIVIEYGAQDLTISACPDSDDCASSTADTTTVPLD